MSRFTSVKSRRCSEVSICSFVRPIILLFHLSGLVSETSVWVKASAVGNLAFLAAGQGMAWAWAPGGLGELTSNSDKFLVIFYKNELCDELDRDVMLVVIFVPSTPSTLSTPSRLLSVSL